MEPFTAERMNKSAKQITMIKAELDNKIIDNI